MKKIICAAMAALIAATCASCGGNVPENKVYEVADMCDKTVGVVEDTASAGYINRFDGNVTVEYYGDAEALAVVLKNGDVDCALADEETYDDMRGETSLITALDDMFVDCDYRLAVSIENRLMLEKLNGALDELDMEGELEKIVDRWQDGEGEGFQASNSGKTSVSVAVDPSFYPYAYYNADGDLAGLEIDVVAAICEKLGLEAEFLTVEPDMLLYMAESGKCSFAIGRIVRDPDSEAVAYTSPYMHSTQLVVVRKG